jgi:HlyD family type I secretion membrane fusion protein
MSVTKIDEGPKIVRTPSLSSSRISPFSERELKSWMSEVPFSSSRLYVLALCFLIAVFGFGGVWAVTAKLGGAIIAKGQITVEGNNWVAQHLEGGIIRELMVEEGDKVAEGQIIAQLDDTPVKSQLQRLEIEKAINLIGQSRWRAELNNRSSAFEVDLEKAGNVSANARVQDVLQNQQSEFANSRGARSQQIDILYGKIANEKQDITYLEELTQSTTRQLELLREEKSDFETLLEKGLTAKSRVSALSREISRLESQKSNAIVAIQKSKNNISSLNDDISRIELEHKSNASAQLTLFQQKLNENEDLEIRLRDLQTRLTIRAPISGTVLNIPVKSIGAIVEPRSIVAEILPEDNRLVLEVRVPPAQIKEISLQQNVEMIFPEDQTNITQPLPGKVEYISADSFSQENREESFYIVRVGLGQDLAGRKITPGNVADVFFLTEPKTFAQYLADPITRFTQRVYGG